MDITAYLDKDGLMHDNTGIENTIENGSLFLVYWYFLDRMANGLNLENYDRVDNALMKLFDGKAWHSNADHTLQVDQGFSRDNMIATSTFYGKSTKWKELWGRTKFDWTHWFQPQDMVWFNLMADKWWAKPLSIVPQVSMLYTCNYLTPCGNGNLDTDGMLMTWLRLQAVKDNSTMWNSFYQTCEGDIADHMYDYLTNRPQEIPLWTASTPEVLAGQHTTLDAAVARPWRTLFSMYFQDQGHPINQLSAQIWR